MTGNDLIEVIRFFAQAFAGIDIADFQSETGGNGKAQVHQLAVDGAFRFGQVDERQREFPAGQMAEDGVFEGLNPYAYVTDSGIVSQDVSDCFISVWN